MSWNKTAIKILVSTEATIDSDHYLLCAKVNFPPRWLNNFAQLASRRVFSTIDLVKVYHQIPVHPDDIAKTAIITLFGLFEFPYMSFGLRNAVQTF